MRGHLSRESRTRTAAAILVAVLVTLCSVAVLLVLPRPTAADASSANQLTFGACRDLEPSFSPNGKQIAFASDRSGSFDIWLIGADGRKLVQLTWLPGDERQPRFSPDGKTIAFLASQDGGMRLMTLNVYRSGVVDLADVDSTIGSFSWSPSGNTIAYDSDEGGSWNVWLSDSHGGGNTRLTGAGGGRYPSWTPDGGGVLYSANLSGQLKVFLMNVTGGAPLQVTGGPGNDIMASMSPDGQHIAFVSDRAETWQVWVMFSNGTGLRPAGAASPGGYSPSHWSPAVDVSTVLAWSADGKTLVFSSAPRGNSTDIFRLDVDATVSVPFGSLMIIQGAYGDVLTDVVSNGARNEMSSLRADGKIVAVSSDKSGAFHIWTLPVTFVVEVPVNRYDAP